MQLPLVSCEQLYLFNIKFALPQAEIVEEELIEVQTISGDL